MTTINQTKTTYQSYARRHLETDKGVDYARTRTALMSAFTDGTHYNIGSRTDGMIPAGAPVMDDGSGTVIPASAAGPDNTDPADPRHVYFLLDDTDPNGSTHVGLGVMHFGDFILPNLPYAMHADARTKAETQGCVFFDNE